MGINRSYRYNHLPHAVSFVENNDRLIKYEEQNMSYTDFNKVSSVSENIGSDNYVLNVFYGPDQQRWRTTLSKNSVLQKTIIFAGDYEQVTANGITQKICYIGGGNGLAALYVKQEGQPDKGKMYTLRFILHVADKWIEGIGSTFGLFWNHYYLPTDGNTYHFSLSCFKQNDEVKYINNKYNQCFCFQGAGMQNQSPDLSLMVYPDYKNSAIRIEGKEMYLPYCFELIDTQGQIILRQTIRQISESIPLNKLIKGVYLYRIIGEADLLKSGKIIL